MLIENRPASFLGVENSVLGRPWRDRLDLKARAMAEAIVQQHGLPDALSRVLAGRGVGCDDCLAFLEPTIRALMPDPSALADMDSAAARIAHAAERGETVAIFGDYDVDGACSSALLAQFLNACGAPNMIHIPDRIFEGYGPNSDAIRALRQRGASLLVTVDCGVTSHGPLADAAAVGLDVVVLDHHQAPVDLPKAHAIVNPNRQDDLSGLGHLCAAGVTFMALVATNRILRKRGFWTASRPAPDLMAMVDLVALATVADVVPLKGLNRAFVLRGLDIMHQRGRPGLRALFDAARASGPPRAQALGFLIGPRINAGGRIGDAGLGARLLLEHDDVEADRIAAELDLLNRERQEIEAVAVAEAYAEALAALGDADDASVIVTAAEGWHPGVVGLVAARLKERFGRPAVAISLGESMGTGSARSVPGADIGAAVRGAVDAGVLIKGGGHAMAAGLTIERTRLGDLRAFLEARLAAAVTEARRDNALLIDAALTAGGARPELVNEIERAGPFGSGSPDPIFAFPDHIVADAAIVGGSHVRVRLESRDRSRLSAIAFRCADQPLGKALLGARGEALHVAGTLSLDRWGGAEKTSLRIVDVARRV
ncbi:MAG: single-stranded-DNA-specific exonuclease RecJ [Beijerinckiaceae bacterium]|nr:single-stranded-DNA-specific exonuclease RecJ [Beijerinckiaceae bacterium]